jgi:hypothetical protein
MPKLKKDWIDLPESFHKGLIVDVEVSINGKTDIKQLKACTVKAQSIIFMEVDKVNRKNIFRKVKRRDIIQFTPTAICGIKVRDGVLPDRWESGWDSIGQPTHIVQIRGRGLASQYTKHFSNHSKGWAPKLPSTTNNPVSGFPMV